MDAIVRMFVSVCFPTSLDRPRIEQKAGASAH
jgi:hypothetical protein